MLSRRPARPKHDGRVIWEGGAWPAWSENWQRALGEDQREGAAGDDDRAQPIGLDLANRLSGKGERVGHVCGVRPQLLPKG